MHAAGWVVGALLAASALAGCSGPVDLRCGLLGICPRPTAAPSPAPTASTTPGTKIALTGRLDTSDGGTVRVDATLTQDTAGRLAAGSLTLTNDGTVWHRHVAGPFASWIAAPAPAGCTEPARLSASGACWVQLPGLTDPSGPQGLQPGESVTQDLKVAGLLPVPAGATRFVVLVPSSTFDMAGVTLLHQCPRPAAEVGPTPASGPPGSSGHVEGRVVAASDGPVTCADLP